MKSTTMGLFAIVLCFGLLVCDGQETTAFRLPEKPNFHLFLLIGQSNMAGRGMVEAQDREPHPRVVSFNKKGEWRPAVDPIHFDKTVAGVGLGRTFGIELAEANKAVTIGLIPSACGGSPIASWTPGGYWKQTKSHPYDDAIKRAKDAMKMGTLKGILWHQGESDSKPGIAEDYERNLTELIKRLRKELDTPSLPFILGQLGRFDVNPWPPAKTVVDNAQKTVAQNMDNVWFASSEGLTCKQDKIHFDAKSFREFGRRYARIYLDKASQ